MKRSTGSPLQDVDTPHLSFVHQVFKILFFLLATPICIWLAISFVIPVFFGIAKKPEAFVDYLRRVQNFELVQAKCASPEIKIGDTVLLEEAWPYTSAVALVKRFIPQEEQGVFITGQGPERSRLQNISDGAGDAPPPSAGNPAIDRLSHKANAWLADRFYPIQSAWLSVMITRGWYAVQMLPIALVACFAAFFIGEYSARKRSQEGLVPMGNRFQGWMHTLKYAIATIPGFMALPVYAPTIPVLFVLYFVVLYAISSARTHFVEI